MCQCSLNRNNEEIEINKILRRWLSFGIHLDYFKISFCWSTCRYLSCWNNIYREETNNFHIKKEGKIDWSPVVILSRIETSFSRTIQGISLDMLCQRSDITLRGLPANYQPRSKLNLHETERPVSMVFHEPWSAMPDLRAKGKTALMSMLSLFDSRSLKKPKQWINPNHGSMQ